MSVVNALNLLQHQKTIRHIFHTGGVFAYPTEGVFGLGGNPYLLSAYRRIVALKERGQGKGMIVVGAEWKQLYPLLALNPVQLQQLILPWENSQRATTFVLPASKQAPVYLLDSKAGNIAVRVARHPVVAGLCRLCTGALLSTSANPSGAPPATTAAQVREYFPDIPIIAGSLGEQTRPSRIVDIMSNTILRD